MEVDEAAGLPLPQHRDSGIDEVLDFPFKDAPERGALIPIADGLYWLRMPLPFGSLDHINLYVLDDGEAYTLVDTGLSTSMVRDIWKDLLAGPLSSKPVARIMVTHYHPDHAGLAGWLAEELGVDIWMSRTEFLFARTLQLDATPEVPPAVIDFFARAGFPKPALQIMKGAGHNNYARGVWPLPISFRRLKDGDDFVSGQRKWKVVEGSGHSPEHACLFDASENILISGDQVLPRITSNIGVWPSEPMANPLDNWFRSIERLRGLPGDTLVLPAHHEPFRGLHKRLDEIWDSHVRRLKAVSKICLEPCSAIEAFPALFKRKLKGMDYVLATAESLAHLHYLEVEGYLERLEGESVTRFRAIKAFEGMPE
ncbi:MAG: MBL fold metallo-hydrolase [Sphingomonadales bacterium]